MNIALQYILGRASEASTWRGLIMLITGIFGFNLSPEVASTAISCGVALSGLIGAALPDSAAGAAQAAPKE